MRANLSVVGGRLLWPVALTGVLLAAPAVLAQQASGIAGTVRDTTGAVLPGVTVEAASPALIEKVRTVVTDSQGLYNIVDLRPGTYTVTFTLPGFNTIKRAGIELRTGFTATVSADMGVGDVAETITISAASPVVDIRNIGRQEVMSRDIIDALPTGKLWANLATLVPGVLGWTNSGGQDSGGAQGSDGNRLIIHGSRLADTQLRVDGMPAGKLEGSGSPAQTTPNDAIIEETVLSIGANAAEIETGGVYVNIIPRSGANTYSSGVFASFANKDLQWNNVTDLLRAQGVTSGIKHNTDATVSFGGPIRRDHLWIFAAARDRRGVQLYDLFPDTNNADWVYTPDTRNPTSAVHKNWDVSSRVTWQASARQKFDVGVTAADDPYFPHVPGGGNGRTPVATLDSRWPNRYTQVKWTSPVTNSLLLEAAGQLAFAGWKAQPQRDAVAPAAFEQSTGIFFRSKTFRSATTSYQDTDYGNHFARFSASYVTGTHTFKVGAQLFPASSRTDSYGLADYTVTLLNGRPVAVTYFPFPFYTDTYAFKTGVFVQDQWKVQRLTMNLGLRFDSIDTHYPDYHLAATSILPAREFPGADVLRWRDLSPRLGVAYDLFGNGRTAIKASAARYVAAEITDTTRSVDPTRAVGSLTRSWNDNGDFIPQGDPLNPAANGEIGPSPNARYGEPRFALRLDPDYARGGFGSRGYQWEFSTSIQHELAPGVSANLGYFRRIYGNLTVTDNLAVAPTDYDPFCIAAPRDARLPGGAGQQICGLYDIKPSKVGPTDNLRTLANKYGDQYEHHDAIDLTVNARVSRGLLFAGGLSTIKSVTDNCDVVTKLDNPSTRFCHAETPHLVQLKFSGSYLLPWGFQIAGTYSDAQGIGSPDSANFGLRATYVATNAVVAPSLGRNLAATSNVSVPLLEPGAMYLDRVRQLDLRFARTFEWERTRIKALIDFYNIFNANTTVLANDTYGVTGAAWLNAQSILLARYVKFGVQVDF